MKICKHVPLADYTTMRVGGPARFFAELKTREELREAAEHADKNNLPIFVLGGGSNLVISDSGIDALVLRPQMRGVLLEPIDENRVRVVAEAGEGWDTFVGRVVGEGLSGLENLSLIPGTVGAAPIQNIGAYGTEVSDTIEWVELFDIKTSEFKKLSRDECVFGYRTSVFKQPDNKHLIVTRVAFLLKKNVPLKIDYKDVRAHFAERGIEPKSASDVRDAIVAIRTAKLPDFKNVGTAGSMFKNPVLTREHYDALLKKYPELPGHEMAAGVKVPLAWILDHICDLRGYRAGAFSLHEHQPLVVVHHGGGTALELYIFTERVRERVRKKTDILPEYEVVFVGDFAVQKEK